jgi:hypothetical protein
MPFTEPNRYSPRSDWAQRLTDYGPTPPPANSWQFDMVLYWQWRNSGHRSLMDAWTDLRMRIDHAKQALMKVAPTPNNDSGMIPPEIFSHLLARSRSTVINPGDDTFVILEPPVDPKSATLSATKKVAAAKAQPPASKPRASVKKGARRRTKR